MANQRPASLNELSERLTTAVADNITSFLVWHRLANAALDFIKVDTSDVDNDDLAEAIAEEMSEAVHEDTIERVITQSLKEAGITNEPAMDAPAIRQQIGEAVNATDNAAMANFRPQPSVFSMDVTALREQILTNCRVIHDLYNDPLPNKMVPTEILITSDGDGLFRAFAIRTFPKQGIVITVEGMACTTTVEALETLYRRTCDVLARARGRAKEKGGDLGSWKYMRP